MSCFVLTLLLLTTIIGTCQYWCIDREIIASYEAIMKCFWRSVEGPWNHKEEQYIFSVALEDNHIILVLTVGRFMIPWEYK